MSTPAETPTTDARAARGSGHPRDTFRTTRWSVVLHAGRNDTPRAREALSQLCQVYWYPLYAYVRRRGYPPPDAEDLTQSFFARLLEDQELAAADPARGRFRSFLLVRLNHFLADAWDRDRAQKRGGGAGLISWDGISAESRYQLEPLDLRSPDRLYEKRWAMTVLERALARLRLDYEQEGKGALYEALKGCLVQARAAVAYDEVGPRLGIGEAALRVAAHRLRQRYRTVLRAEVADTVSDPALVEDELRHLVRALAAADL